MHQNILAIALFTVTINLVLNIFYNYREAILIPLLCKLFKLNKQYTRMTKYIENEVATLKKLSNSINVNLIKQLILNNIITSQCYIDIVNKVSQDLLINFVRKKIEVEYNK